MFGKKIEASPPLIEIEQDQAIGEIIVLDTSKIDDLEGRGFQEIRILLENIGRAVRSVILVPVGATERGFTASVYLHMSSGEVTNGETISYTGPDDKSTEELRSAINSHCNDKPGKSEPIAFRIAPPKVSGDPLNITRHKILKRVLQ